MKKLFLILFLFPAFVFGQINLNNNTVTISSVGVLTAVDVYGKATFSDKAVTVTGGTNVIVSDGAGTLFVKTAANYVTWSGDICILQYAGNYIIDFALYGTGNVNTDWKIQRANKRGVTVTYGDAVAYCTTDGASNYSGGSLNAFIIGGQVGDRVYLVLTRIAGSGDFTVRSGRFQIRRL